MASSQHQNGAAESLIKMVKGVKKLLEHSIGEHKLTYNEMNSLMAEVSNLVNERPIGVQPNTRTDPEYISPNSLYLGRTSARISAGPFQPDELFTDDPSHNRAILASMAQTVFPNTYCKTEMAHSEKEC